MEQRNKKRRAVAVNVAARSAFVIGLTASLVFGASSGVAAPFVSFQSDGRASQQQPQSPQQKPDAGARNGSEQELRAGAWRVLVKADANPVTMRIRANEAPLAEIAGEISRQLRVPVNISPALRERRITLKADDVLLETVLRTLAPHVYVDYLVTGESAASLPRYKAIYLNALEEAAPDPEAGFTNTVGVTLIEGNTDEMIDDGKAGTTAAQQTTGEAKELPLVVLYENNKLSVRARRQPLTMVLFEIANAVKVPLDMQLESGQLVDVDFKEYDLEQAVRALPAKAQLYLRTDLQTMTSTPLRFVLAAK